MTEGDREPRIVGLAHDVYVSGIERARQINRVEYYVVVVGVSEGEPVQYFLPFSTANAERSTTNRNSQVELCRSAPFVPIEGGAPLELLEGLTEGEQLSAAKDAFRAIRQWSQRYEERVIADLYAFAVRKLISRETPTLCFVAGPVTTKIAGRLGYLYLSPEVTVAIVHSDPQDLMTSILSRDAGLFDFDLWYLRQDSEAAEPAGMGPYPGNLEEAILQTYFMRPRRVGRRAPLPLRIDILAQGIPDRALAEKRTAIERVLNDPSKSRPRPVPGTSPEETIVLPNLVVDAKDNVKLFIEMLKAPLESGSSDASPV